MSYHIKRNSLLNNQFPPKFLCFEILHFMLSTGINIRTCQTLMDRSESIPILHENMRLMRSLKSIKIRRAHTYVCIIQAFWLIQILAQKPTRCEMSRELICLCGGHSEFPIGATFDKDTYVGSQPTEPERHIAVCASASLPGSRQQICSSADRLRRSARARVLSVCDRSSRFSSTIIF